MGACTTGMTRRVTQAESQTNILTTCRELKHVYLSCHGASYLYQLQMKLTTARPFIGSLSHHNATAYGYTL